MKSVKIASVILLILFVLDKAFFQILKRIDSKVYTGAGIGKINQFLSLKDTAKVMVFGNSRANTHINPAYFSNSSFNIGGGGMKMAYSAVLIQTLPIRTKQVVLLQIDPAYVFDTTYKGEDIKALNYKYHQNRVIKEKIDEIGMKNPFSNFFQTLDYNGKVFSLLMNYVRPKYDYTRFNGYEPRQLNKDQKLIRARIMSKDVEDREPNVHCKNIKNPSKLELMYLNQIRDFCAKNNKLLILFTSPVYNDKCGEDNIAMQKLMKNLSLEYYDYTNYFKGRDNIDWWVNENHLSKQGADLFSKLLADKLKPEIENFCFSLNKENNSNHNPLAELSVRPEGVIMNKHR